VALHQNNGIIEGFHRQIKLIQRRPSALKTSLTTACALSLNAANNPKKIPHPQNLVETRISEDPFFS
jgi:hypothetical protein